MFVIEIIFQTILIANFVTNKYTQVEVGDGRGGVGVGGHGL